MLVTRATAATFAALRDDHFHCDFLKCDLVVNEIQQFQSARVRHVIAMQFDPGSFSGQFRMRRQHLSIKQEGDIGVEFLLELMQPEVRIIPRPWFVHDEEDFIPLRIEREQVDHIGVFDACRVLRAWQLVRHDIEGS